MPIVIGLVLSSAVWAIFALEIWFLRIILMQFLGGEEQPVGDKKHRRSLYLALVSIGGLSGFLEYLAHNLTNPLCLWTFAIAFFGGTSVFQVRWGKMLIAISVIFVLIGLQNQLFAMISGVFGG